MAAKDITRYLENWQNEVDSAAQYHSLAEVESSPELSRVYKNLAVVEEEHIAFWENHLKTAGEIIPKRTPSWRSRILIWLASHFGTQMVLSTISGLERSDQNGYRFQKESSKTKMASQENWHVVVLNELEKNNLGASGSSLAKIEGRHKNVGSNALRAAVLGANDGLCSNMSLVMGALGASMNQHSLMLTGVAGLFAGSCSMALGEWISVTSARELAEREIRIEGDELAQNPKGEGDELKLIYESKGLQPEEARKLSVQMLSNQATALDTLAREELGINPKDLGGNAFEAALYSFILFAIGALIPVVPFFVLSSSATVLSSAVLRV